MNQNAIERKQRTRQREAIGDNDFSILLAEASEPQPGRQG